MSGLRRVARQAARAEGPGGREERCDLCAEPLPPGHPHRHVLQSVTGTVSCACRACAVLFDHDATSAGGYRLLPQERRRLEDCHIDDAVWAGLGVPVSLAFFTRSGDTGEVTAAYPSPLGALRATVPPDSWREAEQCHPDLPEHVTDVQALLVHRARGADEYWLVPLDDCYRLVAVVRAHWKGLDGGPEVWQRVEDFFRALTEPTEPTEPTPFTTEEASWASP
ncbi:DUF5947 family protein [Streptomyces sp. S.PNR 29]|uniref:DUF5947 family protein n=1 Tax=Streptomyces sp. S.PNR 29 TaxID=2973805 RepID=UPI0025B1E8E4|nr:DUF5947 family protein [Streptomyces sp. S.PNR 29]MDN0199204.1 DUF5947 family protein [Streptomyces sp. S.PNR 29]